MVAEGEDDFCLAVRDAAGSHDGSLAAVSRGLQEYAIDDRTHRSTNALHAFVREEVFDQVGVHVVERRDRRGVHRDRIRISAEYSRPRFGCKSVIAAAARALGRVAQGDFQVCVVVVDDAHLVPHHSQPPPHPWWNVLHRRWGVKGP